MSPEERAHACLCEVYKVLDTENIRVEKAVAVTIEKDVRKDYRILLQNILDFIGLDGIVHDEYSQKRDSLCRSIREAMK